LFKCHKISFELIIIASKINYNFKPKSALTLILINYTALHNLNFYMQSLYMTVSRTRNIPLYCFVSISHKNR